MGWLRKIGRKIDRGVRKVFGKNGWFKAAATVAALVFVAPIFGTGPMAFSPAGAGVGAGVVTESSAIPKLAGDKLIGKEAVLFETQKAAEMVKPTTNIFTSMTDSTVEFLKRKGTQIKELPQTAWEQVVGTDTKKSIFEKGQTLVAETAEKALQASIIEQAMGEEQFYGSAKGVQEMAANEPALVQNALAYSFSNPQDMPSISVTLADPVFAKWSNIS